ncbi:MAG TPA: tetratricopeptide repeat protein [Bacteroidia bacterium]|nr:tetratricopeptide repeat protein [Bacteroidia bacterium]
MDTAVKRDYGKWRAISLAAVYLLMGVHIAHWKQAGRTLAPLEFNEVLYTVHLGIVTAGFLFMGLTMIATLVAGRFFCSWMCHMVALQDGSAWLLNKVGIRPRHIRSRTLLWLPFAAVIYLFVLPQIERAMTGQPPVSLHIAQDSEGWASFMTTDFWRNLPAVGITLFTFFICGGLAIYVLGSRSFCQYGCPYGMVFALADRVAPGKIKLTGDCTQCGKCTAVCSSHVQVMREVNQFDRVVDPNCLKDMDCVQVCPENALSFGFGKPAGFLSMKKLDGYKKRYDFTVAEDIFLAIGTFIFITIFRGLYDTVPFLLAIALGIILSFGVITLTRLWRKEYVRIGHYVLKRPNRLTSHGKVFSAFMLLMIVFSVHSAFIHVYTYLGEHDYNTLLKEQKQSGLKSTENFSSGKVDRSFERLQTADRYGLWHPASLQRELAALSLLKNDRPAAEKYLEKMLDKLPEDMEGRLKFGKLLVLQGKTRAAEEQLKLAAKMDAVTNQEKHLRAEAALALGHLRESSGFASEALPYYLDALRDEPSNAEVKLALGVLYTRTGQLHAAERLLTEISTDNQNSALIENNLAVICMRQKRYAEAEMHFDNVNRMQPGNVQVLYNLAMLKYVSGDKEAGYASMKNLLARHPEHRNAKAALGMMESERAKMTLH